MYVYVFGDMYLLKKTAEVICDLLPLFFLFWIFVINK